MALDAQPYTPPKDGFFTTDAYTDHAIDFIREARRTAAAFFLYFAHNAPHWPLHARAATIAKYRGKYRAGWDRLRADRYEKMKQLGVIDPKWPLAPRPESLSAWDALPADKQDTWDLWMAVYAAQIEEMDTSVGRLLAALRETGADQNTLVLFFSDNGGAAERPVKTLDQAALGTRDSYEGYAIDGAHLSSAPFRKTKKYTHEGGISSPCIAWWPAGISAERRGQWITTPGHVIDIMPTCLELAGAALPAEHGGGRTTPLAGVSLAPLLAGRTVARPQPLFWEHEGHRAVRDGQWKLVSTFGGPWELYDVVADRTELNDLAAKFPDRVRDLSARYDAWAKTAGVLPWTNLPPAAGGKGGKKKQG
jgi:arylsulfatase